MIERIPVSSGSQNECRSLVEVLRYRRQNSPDQLAFQFLVDGQTEGARLTYRQLDDQAQTIARRLREVVQRGDRALLLYPPGLEFLAAFFGCLKAGVIAVPLPPPDAVRIKRALPRLASVIRDAKAVAVLTTSDIEGMLRSNLETRVAFHRLVWINTESSAADKPTPPGDGGTRDPLPGDLAFLQYTSGSTSAPKGVMVSHRNVMHQCRSLKAAFDYDDHSVTCTWMPYHHDYGLIEGLILPLFAGVPCYVLSPITFIRRPHRWLEAISRYRVTHSQAPNFAYELCVRKVRPQQCCSLDLRHWKVAAVAAEPVRMKTLDAFYERFEPCGFRWDAFTPAYGLAESTLAVASTPPGEGPTFIRAQLEPYERGNLINGGKTEEDGVRLRTVVSCGFSIADTQIEIVNVDTRLRCPQREVGEIWVAGPSVAVGYWNRPEETERVFHARLADSDQRTFLRTGDLGCLCEGRLYVTGREKDMIIIRGLNHYPHDIEHTVEASHAALRPGGGAAFSVDVEGKEELVVVYEIQGRHLADLNTDSVFSAIREAVFNEHDLRTHAIALWKPGSVPKTTSGKIQRRSVRADFLGDHCDAIATWRAVDGGDEVATADHLSTLQRTLPSVRRWLVARLSEITGIDSIAVDPTTRFADLGVDSLRAADLTSELERGFGGRFDPTILWNYTTIDALAVHLVGQDADRPCEPESLGRADAGQSQRSVEAGAIAIVGMGCRLPGGVSSPAEYWRLLRDGIDAIGEVPGDRWSIDDYFDSNREAVGKMYVRHGGFVEHVERFDAAFFGITPRESEDIDPQQRLLLEVTWESLEDAGIAASRLRGSEAGVFVGLSSDDYATSPGGANGLADINAYHTLGTARSIAAGRIAYTLGVHGPVIQVDTACSSSLVAVYQACQSLQAGECNLAIAGGVNLMLSPATMVALCKLTALAPDGRCKAFDAAADGYVRGEGCGMVTLKRKEDAIRDGDTILATICSAVVNHDGASNGLVAPDGQSQQRLLRKAMQKAGIAGQQITYVEAHGTGTELGDPIELAAIDAAYNERRSPDEPLLVGSTKANIGHLEAAAGIAGLIKVVLMLRHQEIPPQLNFNTPNPHVPWDRMALKVPTELQPWSDTDSPRRAAVSSFGFSGTNAHLIVESASSTEQLRGSSGLDSVSPPCLLPLSAKSDDSLIALVRKYIRHIDAHPDQRIEDICFAAATGRDHFKHRLAVVASSRDELLTRLRGLACGQDKSLVVQGIRPTRGLGAAPSIGFLFTGQGSQYPGMGRELYRSQPVFRDAIDRCGLLLRNRLERPLTEILFGQEASAQSRLNQTINTQPALFALQHALVELWKSWGIEPTAVIGHSSGEYAAACTAGVFDLEVGLELVATRGRLLDGLPEAGAMAVVMTDETSVQEAIESFGERVSIAAVNGPDNIVISGHREAIEQALAKLAALGFDCEMLNTSGAGHSALIEPVLERFRAVADTFQYAAPHIAMISNVSGALAGDEVAGGGYWVQHLRARVLFADGMRALADTGCRTFVEIGPHPNLLAMGMACVKGLRPRPRWFPSLAKNRNSWDTILYSLAGLYVAGADIDWQGFHCGQHRHRVPLPTYAFAGRSYPLRRRKQPPAEVGRSAESLLPTPQVVAVALDRLRFGLEDASRDLTVNLDEAAIHFIINALEQLGCRWQFGAEISARQLKSQVPPENLPKVMRVLSRLVERGLLDQVADHYRVNRAVERGGGEAMLDQLPRGADHPECALVRRAGLSLASIWKGDVEPLSILFPGGATDQAAAFYGQSMMLANYNELAGQALREAVSRMPVDAPLRVLEVGAGTGGLTTFLLPHLPAERSEYLFTDLSPLFLYAAKQRFSEFPFLSTRILDIGKPPPPQDFELESFDLVVAANVLHATPRLHDTVGHVRELLKPGGWLMLLEGANPPLWGDMVFTLMDGWWNFQDTDLRPDYPLMRRDHWTRVLGASHFDQVVHLNDANLRDDSYNTLFLARTSTTAGLRCAATQSSATSAASLIVPEHPRGRDTRDISGETFAAPAFDGDDHDRGGDRLGDASDQQRIRGLVRVHAAHVMRLKPADIELNQPLSELGLDSLMATELRARLGDAFDRELALNTLQMRRSVEEIAAYLYKDEAAREATLQPASDTPGTDLEVDAPRAHLVPLQPVGTETPLFFIPAGYGDLYAFQQISHAIGMSQPVHGLQPASAKRVKTFRQMSIYRLVSAYISEIRKVQPQGPYLLSGYSAGAIIAVELARELKRQGEEIGLLVVFDPPSHVPFWLDHFYEWTYRVTKATGLNDLVGRLRSRFARRMFHAVLDEGLRTHTSVTRQHRVAPYPGRITHFRARLSQSSLVSMRPVGPFWRRAAEEGIEVHWIPGTHYGMLRGPGASVVVDELRDCLQRARLSHPETRLKPQGDAP